MTTQFGFAKESSSPPVTPAEQETSRSTLRAIKEDAPPFLFAGAIVVGAASLYKRIFGKKTRKVVRRLVRR
jgi:hypothetical protein